MYDKLVKRLRNAAHWADKGLVIDPSVCFEAAYAIEELQGKAKVLEKLADKWCEAVPKWIPVTERLPNGEAERYLVAAPLMSLGLWVSICYYADNLEEVDEYDFKDEKHSGFYWCDDEYGYNEQSGVKYWMPLPQPPKEET